MLRQIIIAGGRDFNDYTLLKNSCDKILSLAISAGDEIEIISGTAKGADSLGERYAKEKGFKLTKFPAKWDEFGKRAGYIRNKEMADYAGEKNALIAFWNKSSRGTKHMIDIAKNKNMHIRIINY